MSWVISHCEALGYEVTVLNRKNALERLTNVVVGDIKKARNVVLVGYDTPVASLISYKYYPLNYKKNNSFQMKNYLMHLCFSLALITLGVYMVLQLNNLNGGAHVGCLITSLLSFVLSYFIGKGFPNRCNYNRNNAGIAIVLDLIRSKLKHTAYVFIDDSCQSIKGYNLLAGEIDMKDKVIVSLDCVGKGDEIFMAVDEKNESEWSGRLNITQVSNLHVLQVKTDQSWKMGKKNCLIFSGTMDKNDYAVEYTGKNDKEIDFKQLENVKEIILDFFH